MADPVVEEKVVAEADAPADLDVFEKLYQDATAPTDPVEKPVAEDPPPKEEPEIKVPEAKSTPAPVAEEKPFRFEEDRLYPVPGKDGIEYIPYAKYKRWFEAGRGAAQLVEKMKIREKELASPIALSESVKDIPADKHDVMFAEVAAVINKHRVGAGLQPTKAPAVDALPKADRELLEQVREDRKEAARQAHYEKALTKNTEDVKMMVQFAKDSLGIEVDQALGEKIISESEKYAAAHGIGIHQVDLIGVLTRLVPDHMKAKNQNEMELKGQVVPKKAAPVVSPKSVPAPRVAHQASNKKFLDMSQEELAAKSPSEREDMLSSHLREVIGR